MRMPTLGPKRRLAQAFAVTAALLTWSSEAVRAEPAAFTLDPTHTSITFFVSHVGYADLAGMFLKSEGRFTYDEEAETLSDLEVIIDTDSVFTNHDDRDEHLRSADFLNTSEHPTMTFVATDAEKLGDNQGRVSGELTLLGTTKPVTLEVVKNKAAAYPFGDGHYAVGLDITGMINRSDFGMTYGVENDLVGDEIEIRIGLEAIRE